MKPLLTILAVAALSAPAAAAFAHDDWRNDWRDHRIAEREYWLAHRHGFASAKAQHRYHYQAMRDWRRDRWERNHRYRSYSYYPRDHYDYPRRNW